LNLLGQLIILAVMAALLKNLQTAFGSEQVGLITQAVVFMVLFGVATRSFSVAVEIGRGAIEQMVDFMLATIPVLSMLLASLGNLSTAAIFHPVIIFSVNYFSHIVREIIIPLIFFATVLTLINYFSPHFKLKRLADLLRDLSIWALGLLLTVFVGITAIQGITGTVADAVGLRAAKLATGTFIPVVGKMLSEAVETAAGVSLLLKNSVTITGMLILLFITAFPLLKLLSLILIYKVASAVIQPLGDTTLGDCLNAMGNCLALVFGAVATVSLLFFIAITVIMGAGNALLMLR
ncbi:MAG: stage III sporulation protein AE, partial [Dethiobacteria bacterium]